jgi:guanylate kinase
MILTLTGASGAGKTTIAERLIADLPDARFLMSYTTRTPRPNDLPGEYAYLSIAEFDKMNAPGEFLWMANVGKTRYGTSKTALREALEDHQSVSLMILVPEVMKPLFDFAASISQQEAIRPILVLTPPEEILRARMRARGDDDTEIDGRIAATLDFERKARETGIDFIEIGNERGIDDAVREIAESVVVSRES